VPGDLDAHGLAEINLHSLVLAASYANRREFDVKCQCLSKFEKARHEVVSGVRRTRRELTESECGHRRDADSS
jgi:hypothetical protein